MDEVDTDDDFVDEIRSFSSASSVLKMERAERYPVLEIPAINSVLMMFLDARNSTDEALMKQRTKYEQSLCSQ